MSILHRIAHLIGGHKGHPICFWQGRQLMAAFKCSTCGKLDGIHDAEAGMARLEKDLKDHAARVAAKERARTGYKP